MGIGVTQDYSRFYKGTEQLKSYGSASAKKKDTLVKYEFNTVDEKGNKIMDKMSKEESFRIMNEISAQYGDNVIVEFSGDALTILEQYGKGLLGEPEKREPVPTTPLEGVRAFTEEEWKAIEEKRANLGNDMKKNANENPNWLEEYKAAQKTTEDVRVKSSESKLSKRAAAFLEKLRKAYGDFDFIVGNAGDDLRSLVKNSGKEFSVIFSTDELEKMASDEKYAQEKINAMKGAVRMSRQINEQFGFESAFAGNGIRLSKFGIFFNADGTTTFFAGLESKKGTILQADSIEELLGKIRKAGRSASHEENELQTGRRFDFSI